MPSSIQMAPSPGFLEFFLSFLAFPFPGAIRATSNQGGSIFGGGQLGVDWQIGSEVFGVGADIDGLDSSQRFAFAGPNINTLSGFSNNVNGTINLKRNVEGTVRMRFGHAWDRWLLYGTGGIAFSSLDVNSTYNYTFALPPGVAPPPFTNPANAATSFSSSRFLMGPSIGAGVEYAICDNVSLGVDYRHNFFGSKTLNLGMTPTAISVGGALVTPGSPVSARYNLDDDAVMFRVNWRFSH